MRGARPAHPLAAHLLAALAALTASLLLVARAEADSALPPGFQDTVVFSGLEQPTAVRFAADGMVFVAEKAGRILVHEGLDDETPELFKDLRTETYDHGDRGLLGLAVDPDFPTRPYVYALFTYDHVPGSGEPVPEWGTPDQTGDSCPGVPANGSDDCVVSGRLVRYTATLSEDGEGRHAVATAEKALIPEDWCQQFSSHSIGDLRFGPEGALYASGGDGASFTSADYGQLGEPSNPCGDPPREGGSLRAQDLRTPETDADPTGLSGTIARIDPDTGEGLPGNPLQASASANERRIVALGLRNPFRFTLDPSSGEMYAGVVGSSEYEEIDRFDPTSATLYNSGWPCYEGAEKQYQFEDFELPICEAMYAEPASFSPPLFYYSHSQGAMPGDECPAAAGSAISGVSFYEGEEFPAEYRGAFFFSDSVRGCIYVMLPGDDGRPDPNQIEPFLTGGSKYPGIDIQEGPDEALYYVSLFGEEFGDGALHRITYAPGAPTARLSVDTQYAASLAHEYELDAGASSDPDGEVLEFEWDLDDDGNFETAGGATQEVSYSEAENVVVAVRVSDRVGLSNTTKLTLYPGDTPPQPTIDTPAASDYWGVGDSLHLSGYAEDSELAEGAHLEPLYLYWSTRLLHCPTGPDDCHSHPLQVFPGTSGADLVAPEHDYPSYIEVTLNASDERGLTATRTIKLSPREFTVRFASNPAGISLVAGLVAAAAPFEVPSVEGAQLVITAPETAAVGGETYAWQSWSDGGARTHTIRAEGVSDYVAAYAPTGGGGEGESAAPGEPGGETPRDPAASGSEGTEPREAVSEATPRAIAPSASGPRAIAPSASGPPAPASTRPPRIALRRHPGKRTRSRTARFSFGAAEPGWFRCRLDRRRPRRCRVRTVFRHLKPGRHALRVTAVAADRPPVVFRWTVVGAHRRHHARHRRAG